MDTNSFIIHIKTEEFYENIADNVEKRFDTSTYEVSRPLEEKIIIEFVAIRPETYSH